MTTVFSCGLCLVLRDWLSQCMEVLLHSHGPLCHGFGYSWSKPTEVAQLLLQFAEANAQSLFHISAQR